jgi:hypothetical protein
MKASPYLASLASLACALAIGACSGPHGGNPPPPPACVEDLNTGCNMVLFDPTYTNLYNNIIVKQCTAGSSCHSADGAMGGLVLANADDAYDALLGLKGGPKRVLPHDPKCSPLMVRFTSTDPEYQMPRGMPLPPAAICDFVRWIANGALKTEPDAAVP